MIFNRFKYIATAIVALFITAGVLAFDNPEPVDTKKLDIEWFQYLGDVNGNGEENPENYMLVEPQGCDGGQFLCAIQAEEDTANPGHPTQAGVENPLNTEERSTPITP